jgi:hypothetical protein
MFTDFRPLISVANVAKTHGGSPISRSGAIHVDVRMREAA